MWNVRTETVRCDDGLQLVSWLFNPSFIPPKELKLREHILIFGAVLCEKLWLTRNEAFHAVRRTNPTYLLQKINETISEHLQAHMNLQAYMGFDPQIQTTFPHSTKLRLGRIRIFIDAAYKDSRAVAGCVI
ncbi:hypothetical protein PanWU01x14_213040 [Parasponia andersonii]|uniref:Uncharacterized protein n=1 Tax=Parasponia andersonii TaxID=3476 RepID=A0A2P5BSX3_PARAD|nr:hypothetical protein PanWU01x14_213040 [Parasponia andersonii]